MPEGVVSVVPVPVEGRESIAATGAEPAPEEPDRTRAFDNPHWEAWKRLIWGFDR